MNKKVILIILDGWGITQNPKVSAIAQAKTPFIDSLFKKYPNASLRTDGLHVGLPEGQMGNSEVGHMNLGAGRIVYQDLVKINKAVEDGSIAQQAELQKAFSYAKEKNKNVHFVGLVSDGGVHSHINHVKGLVTGANNFGLRSYVHAFTDGRDVDPHSGKEFIAELNNHLAQNNGQLASVIGRYYAMDRDKRWERVKLTYDAMVKGIGTKSHNAIESIQENYDNGVTDEFIKPIVMVNDKDQPISTIKDDDVVIFFNFRTDRGRQITEALSQKDFPEYDMKKLNLYYVTMTNYDEKFKNVHVIYNKDNLINTLGEVLEKNNKKQIRIAETEKYPHVTFFFSGGREDEFVGEKRLMCPSPKVATYDLQPEMSAKDITAAIIPELDKKEADFICLNFANTDMVGHTGVLSAAIKAAETVDKCTEEIIESVLKNDYTAIIIADHGNSETMINEDGSPNTAHTTNPVPIIIVDKDIKSVKSGILADIAPTVLKLIGVDKPEVMDRESLI
ncbi:2,3-bisphosphoglycerate-independent phosphoglycerate mutase [Aureibaculum sp. A20]|uniref:2,3-bisphosphoglycerate-independent phosphoglycerate mutase n=1 Tax=Aureibaculum flavum TaxID=2795986 RepID=A0ABS0WVY0_9FLAO|nr:2,3-bisphosphoglycerate-independent phosphoglycerate mutase [Aureibaculum flavum]MBJ2176161.1 2,3-bisphosphoglycerate-independent phosphoglycerate mutase [Aureibaculum flavum]